MNNPKRKDPKSDLIDVLLNEDTPSSLDVDLNLEFTKTTAAEKTLTKSLTEPTQLLDTDKKNLAEASLIIPAVPKDNPVAPETPRPQSGSSRMSSHTPLQQSENLRLAQTRISQLETEIDQLRAENERLLAAGETFQRRASELTTKLEKIESQYKEKMEIYQDEKRHLEVLAQGKTQEVQGLKSKIEELELRLQSDLKRVRVRERELENRLEILKVEEVAVLRSKDEMILGLKRKIDDLTFEMDNYRAKNRDLAQHVEAQQDRIRRTVKALRLALTLLEGDTVAPAAASKKASGDNT